MPISSSKFGILIAWLWILEGTTLAFNENTALLSSTLRTYQKAACDEEWINLKCPETTTISIQFSQYGRTAATPALCGGDLSEVRHPYGRRDNVTCYSQRVYQSIVTLCQKQNQCRFQVDPGVLGGDPCPLEKKSRKFVEVAFKCRPGHFKSIIGCENDVIRLTCNPYSRLAIYSASFGRTEYESIQCPQPAFVEEETCLASFATETVMTSCHGKRECAVKASASVFGRPCKPQSRNYLKVIYACVPRKVLKRKFQGELERDEKDDGDDQEDEDDVESRNQLNEASERNESQSAVVKNNEDTHIKLSSFAIPPSESTEILNQTRNSSDIGIITLISQSINAYAFIQRNSSTLLLLIAISMLTVFLFLLSLLLVRLIYLKLRRKKKEQPPVPNIQRRKSSSSLDELSLILNPSDYMISSTLQRNSTSTFGRNNGDDKVVRYSNSRNSLLNPENDEVVSPRSFQKEDKKDQVADVHFVFG